MNTFCSPPCPGGQVKTGWCADPSKRRLPAPSAPETTPCGRTKHRPNRGAGPWFKRALVWQSYREVRPASWRLPLRDSSRSKLQHMVDNLLG
jgi:hypothetical protein